MNKKKIITGALIATIITTSGLAYSFASDDTSSNTGNFIGKHQGFHNKGGFGRLGGFMNKLTDEEKSAIESMTNEEKQTFFETKREEQITQRQNKENVIDKLLAGQSLTGEEETIRQEIIQERADRKSKMEARQEEIATMKSLIEKQDAGETLTTEEQSQLDSFQANRGHRGHR